MSVGWVGATAAVGGALISADASSSAASAQQDSINQANGLTNSQYQQTRVDNAPWLQAGTAGVNRLSYFLGTSTLSGVPGANRDAPDREALRQQYEAERMSNGTDVAYGRLNAGDQAAYNQEVDRRYASALDQYQASQLGAAQQDPAYGSLLKKFGQSDLDSDPIFQNNLAYGLQTGTAGLNRLAAANGSLNSGAQLKALTKFGINENNTLSNDSFNRFQTENTNTYNRLAGISGSGQNAVNTVSSSGANAANSIGNNIIGLGNSRAASAIGTGNALTGAISSGLNSYNNSQLLNRLYPSANSSSYSGYVGNATSNGFGPAFTQSNIYG